MTVYETRAKHLEGLKWYVGLNSALYLEGKTWQAPNTLVE